MVGAALVSFSSGIFSTSVSRFFHDEIEPLHDVVPMRRVEVIKRG
jgi:hypothetical protein